MTSFEYLSVIVAIVIALGIAQILIGVGRVALGDVRSYWIHSLWLGYLLMVYLHTWVAMWSLRGAAEHTVTIFLFYLIGMALPFVAGQVLLAGSFPQDAEQHYFRVKTRFFGLLAVGAVWAFAHHKLVLGSPSGGLPQLSVVPFFVLQALTGNRYVHATLSLLALLGIIISFLRGPGQLPFAPS